jgi:hypothetical protein
MFDCSERKICQFCNCSCSVSKTLVLTVLNPVIYCPCGMLSVDIKEGSIFAMNVLSLVEQLSMIKGFINHESVTTLSKKIRIKESVIVKYFGQLRDRLNWMVTLENQFLSKFPENLPLERDFYVDRNPIYRDKSRESFFLVAGMFERNSNKLSLHIINDDEEYFKWVQQRFPASAVEKKKNNNSFKELCFLSNSVSERNILSKNCHFPGARFWFQETHTEENDRLNDPQAQLQFIFSFLQKSFDLITNSHGKKESSLQRIINLSLFQANNLQSFLQLFQMENEKKFQQYLEQNTLDDSILSTSTTSVLSTTRCDLTNEVNVLLQYYSSFFDLNFSLLHLFPEKRFRRRKS